MALQRTRDFLQRFWHLVKPQDPYQRFAELYKKTLEPRIDEAFKNGEPICHLVILSEEEDVCWDEYLPPKLKYECTLILRDNQIFKFFQREQNFPFAKKFLLEKNFAKIDCGYESFPMHVRQIEADGVQTVYNYVKRPFIHLSSVEQGPGSRQMLMHAIGPAFTSD